MFGSQSNSVLDREIGVVLFFSYSSQDYSLQIIDLYALPNRLLRGIHQMSYRFFISSLPALQYRTV